MTASAARYSREDVAGTRLDDFDVRPYLDGLGAVLAGPANVIMQLALAPVGRGVVESKVESGQVTRHPFKRARTTFTYLAVAMLGTDEERASYCDAVNESHRPVRSDEASPVAYNAFDPKLQLWVAACLYYGTLDIHERMHGSVGEDQADALYRYCARYGTTLQVSPDMWPADRYAFDEYWNTALAQVAIDEPVRRYLLDLASLDHLPWRPPGAARFNLWVTTGFLPPLFREQMQLTWTACDQDRFDRFLRWAGVFQRCQPLALRTFGISYWLWDMRRRMRKGRALV